MFSTNKGKFDYNPAEIDKAISQLSNENLEMYQESLQGVPEDVRVLLKDWQRLLEQKNSAIIELLNIMKQSCDSEKVQEKQPDYEVVSSVYSHAFESSRKIIYEARESAETLANEICCELAENLSRVNEMYRAMKEYRSNVDNLMNDAAHQFGKMKETMGDLDAEVATLTKYSEKIDLAKFNIIKKLTEDFKEIPDDVMRSLTTGIDTEESQTHESRSILDILTFQLAKRPELNFEREAPESAERTLKSEKVNEDNEIQNQNHLSADQEEDIEQLNGVEGGSDFFIEALILDEKQDITKSDAEELENTGVESAPKVNPIVEVQENLEQLQDSASNETPLKGTRDGSVKQNKVNSPESDSVQSGKSKPKMRIRDILSKYSKK